MSNTSPGLPPSAIHVRAEYDRANNRIVALEAMSGDVYSTDTPRVLGAETEWLNVDVRYPEDYHPNYPYLLKRQYTAYSYDEDRNVVVVSYPESDFSPEAVRAAMEAMINDTAKSLLGNTDWAIVRQAETGKSIPPEIIAERQSIRDRATKMKADLRALRDAELDSFEVMWTDGESSTPEQHVAPGGDGSEWVTDATTPDQKGKPQRPALPEERHLNSNSNSNSKERK